MISKILNLFPQILHKFLITMGMKSFSCLHIHPSNKKRTSFIVISPLFIHTAKMELQDDVRRIRPGNPHFSVICDHSYPQDAIICCTI